MEKRYAGLILAAGYSSRMGDIKALLPFGDETLIERQIRCFLSAGVRNIYIVVGHKSEEIIRVAGRYPIITVYNEKYPEGMFTSVQAGVSAICANDFDGIFLLPVDYALTQPFTISCLAKRFEQRKTSVIYPCFGGRKGHPPLFDLSLLPEILSAEPDAGLKSILELHKDEAEYIDMGNATCLVDIDSKQDYIQALEYLEKRIAPDTDECKFIYKYYNVSETVIKHCTKVAVTAKTIAEVLKEKGYDVDPDIIFFSGLLHDISKGAGDHAGQAANALSSMGYPKAARMVANHMDISEEYASGICNESILYFADKITEQEQTVDIVSRLSSLTRKYNGDSERMRKAQKRLFIAANLQGIIEAALGEDVIRMLVNENRK